MGKSLEKELILTIGLPRSGKSTWCRSQKYPIVNPDSIRLALHGNRFLQDAEPMIWCIAKYMVKALFLAGHDTVILDATNTKKERREFWESNDWKCRYVYFNTPKEECIERAKESNREDLIPIIIVMNQEKDFDVCPRCKGFGEIMKRDKAIDSDDSEDIGNTPYVATCPRCKGEGVVIE